MADSSSEPEPETDADGTAPDPVSTAADPEPLVRRSDDISYESVDAADGLEKGVLIGDKHGAPHFAIRRFVLEPGADVPKHTNDVEHEQYVLEGEYVVGIADEEYEVTAGDSLLIPAGAVHWYRNEGDEPGAFLCAVPNGDDEIELLE
ncbi:cupin domain-containing protein [Halopiger xanaduensis]|uniref:Cupin 2 conserved barrel domain protein n=1 Tax=Halopiger xanaduensis (strain DSM 18323 / JCM 14033 / SH-6) TaxID=797210 RepID=F8D402_HALXS|nr:cupin domain-containing protein [Halopiger xanaduensis]AEH36255.1 Cupin 2 conserved barrel domain protein [Halopiger xanaduensis SH-6]